MREGALMEEPRRLMECSDSPLERELLREGRNYKLPARTVAKTAAALGVGGASWLSAKALLGAQLTPFKTIVVATAAVAGGYATVQTLESPEAPAPAAPVSVEQPSQPVKAAPPAPKPASQSVEIDQLPPATPEAQRSQKVEQPTKSDLLREELEALDHARSALLGQSPARALQLVDEYEQRFPKGRLRLEAEALRIDALARAGQHAQAQSRAKRFVERHPDSFLTSRVRRHIQ